MDFLITDLHLHDCNYGRLIVFLAVVLLSGWRWEEMSSHETKALFKASVRLSKGEYQGLKKKHKTHFILRFSEITAYSVRLYLLYFTTTTVNYIYQKYNTKTKLRNINYG